MKCKKRGTYMIAAMILAGGTGSRVGLDRPKQFVEILGKPAIAYTLEIYEKCEEIDTIQVVCHKEWKEYLKEIVRLYNFTKVKWIVDGGETYQQSVMNGIDNLKNYISADDMVMIHYGAAPFTSQQIINDAIEVCRKHGNSVSCTPCYQLMGTKDDDKISTKWVDRDKYIQIACPQSFKFDYLLSVYERADEKNLIADTEPHTTSLMYALGDTIYQSYSDQTNIKITTKEDLYMFEGYVLMKNKHNNER